MSRIQAGTVADYQYARDAAGNITSLSGFQTPKITASDAGSVQYDYVANHLVSMSGRSYVYDSDGNILSDGIRTFAYNQDNRLVRVSIGGVVVGEYAYDAYGRRVKKVASGVTTLYHYVGGNLIAETDENGNPQRDYIYFNGEPLALRIYGAQFGTMYYFVNDHLGTPQKIVDNTGSVVWAAAYLPFGKAQVKPNAIENNLRFPGQYFDAESGLHYNWHRYYDPETGRYLTPDPIGFVGGINLFVYVNGNPVRFTDPSGLRTPDQIDPTSIQSCAALRKMIDYFQKNSGSKLFNGPYAAYSFSSDLTDLNSPYQTVIGPVDADWMFHTYAYGIGGLFPHAPTPIFYFSKVVLRNLPATIAGEGGLFSELDDPSYTNAPKAMWYLIVRHPFDFDIGDTLKDLFAPALKACQCKGL